MSFQAMAREYVAAGDHRHEGALEDFALHLRRLRSLAAGENLLPGHVPVSTFWLVCGRRVLGVSRLRHRLTRDLEHEGGHVGYDVRPKERGRGRGKALLRLMLAQALARGIARVRVTCDDDNVASARVIESNGGRLTGKGVSRRSGKLVRQYWIDAPAVLGLSQRRRAVELTAAASDPSRRAGPGRRG